ncbi:MAG: hypothetical protein L3J14_06050 [Flavobacteriaceae bacterium]|nr:hypothetical protein [Flavobacteriaceae bacterium]
MKRLNFATKLTILIGLMFLSPSCSKTEESEITTSGPPRGELLINTRLFEFDSSLLNPWIDNITHLRSFGVDFSKPKNNEGLYQYIDDNKMNDYIAFCNSKNLKIVWTLNLSSFTLDQEIAYVKDIISRGLNIVAFEYGGEFYLKKYFIGDLDAKGVVETIRMDGENRDYLNLIDIWLPAMTEEFPIGEYEHILVTASLTGEQNITTEYRKEFNEKVFDYVENNPNLKGKMSFSYHLYAGAKPSDYNEDEEIIYTDNVDWSFLDKKPEDSRWVVTESGHYVSDFSQTQLNQARNFYEKQAEQLGNNDLMGIHTLLIQTTNENPLALYSLNGITPVGLMIQSWLEESD